MIQYKTIALTLMGIKLLGKTEQDIVVGLQCMCMSPKCLSFEKTLFNVAELESLTIEIRLPFTKLLNLVMFYRPGGPVKVYNDIHNLISNILFEDKEFIMMGDANPNLLSKPLDNDAKHMKQYDSNNITQLITEPIRTTGNTKTLIDHAVTNRPSQILDSGVIPCGISDHDSIYIL